MRKDRPFRYWLQGYLTFRAKNRKWLRESRSILLCGYPDFDIFSPTL